MNPQDLVDKIDYEGGIYDAVAGYGLGVEDLTDATPAQLHIWKKVVNDALRLRDSVDSMRDLFPSVSGAEEDE